VTVLVQAPLHTVGVAAAHATHTLAEQYDPAAQTCAHEPQLFTSVRVSMHAAPHAVAGAAHRHTLALQD